MLEGWMTSYPAHRQQGFLPASKAMVDQSQQGWISEFPLTTTETKQVVPHKNAIFSLMIVMKDLWKKENFYFTE